MAKITLPITTYQTPEGNPVANGFLLINLSSNGVANNTQLQTNKVKVNLDSSGIIIGSPTFWPNSEISPSGTYYFVSTYTAKGQLVCGPIKTIL